jgi:hypothetical protein
MTQPEDAVERARAEAEAGRARGAYDEAPPGFRVESTERVDAERLGRWALIEPDADEVYSTRRFGTPITLVKRALLRILAQYHAQILAQQSRFNAQVASHLVTLEERVDRLEARARAEEPASER